MLAENLGIFSLICKLASAVHGILFVWDSTSNSVRFVDDEHSKIFKKNSKNLKFRCCVHTVAALIVIFQTILSVTGNNKNSLGVQFLNGLGSIVLVATNIYCHAVRRQQSQIVLLVNGLLQFSQNYQDRKLKKYEKKKFHFNFGGKTRIEQLNIIFANAMFVTGILLPITFVYGLHWRNPCKAALAGSLLLKECSRAEGPGPNKIFAKVVILLFNHWLWAFGYGVTVFAIGAVQILGAMSLRDYLRLY